MHSSLHPIFSVLLLSHLKGTADPLLMDMGVVSSPLFLLFSPCTCRTFLSSFPPAQFKATVYYLSFSPSSFLSNHLRNTQAWMNLSALLFSCLHTSSQSLLRKPITQWTHGGRHRRMVTNFHTAQTSALALLLALLFSTSSEISPLLKPFLLILSRMRPYLLHGENRSLQPGPAPTPHRNSPALALFSPSSIQIDLGLHPTSQDPHVTTFDFSYIFNLYLFRLLEPTLSRYNLHIIKMYPF